MASVISMLFEFWLISKCNYICRQGDVPHISLNYSEMNNDYKLVYLLYTTIIYIFILVPYKVFSLMTFRNVQVMCCNHFHLHHESNSDCTKCQNRMFVERTILQNEYHVQWPRLVTQSPTQLSFYLSFPSVSLNIESILGMIILVYEKSCSLWTDI
jgi:hypothetical protein